MAREILYAMYIGHGNIHGWQTEDFSRDLFTPLSTLTLITHRQWWSNWTRTSKMTKFNGNRTSVWYSYKLLLVNSLKTGPISKNTSLHRLWHYGNGLEHPDHLRRSKRRCPESLGTVRQGASRWRGRRWGWEPCPTSSQPLTSPSQSEIGNDLPNRVCRHCRRQWKIVASGVNFSRNNAIYNIDESTKYILSWFHL